MPVYVKVAKSNEIQPGTAKGIEAGGKQIALFNKLAIVLVERA